MSSLRLRLAVGAVVAAIPTLVTCALLATLFNATLLDYFPVASDELAYFHQIATFVRAGFGGGYFTNFELPAPFAATHFGVHGPAFPVIYGGIGRIVGWGILSGPLFNLSVLAAATGAFIWTTRLPVRQLVLLGTVLLTSWWVTLMASITMQESLNQAFMIVVAAFAVRLLQPDTERRTSLLLTALAILVAASVLRPTNWIAAVPLVLVAFAHRPALLVPSVLAAVAGIPVFWVVWRLVSAPIPGLAIDLDAAGAGGSAGIWNYFASQFTANIATIFDVASFAAQPFFQYVMFASAAAAAVFACFVVAACVSAVAGRRGLRPADLLTSVAFRVDLLNLIVLGTALVAFLGFYFDSDASISRVMAPFLLLSQLVLVATGRRTWLLAATIALAFLVAPSFVAMYRVWRNDIFTYNRVRFEQFRDQASTLIAFDPDAGPWCNTLLTMSYDREIVGVPAGIGLSVAPPRTPDAPIKSKYLLLRDDGVQRYRSRADLQHLGTTALGDVYLNRTAYCR
jgi:hypothetical protein